MRFARSGRNWEGREWVVNDAIHFLAAQIEEAWPERHPADGTVASKTHDQNSPNSDHRPYPYNGSGIVYALDMGEVTEDDGALLCEKLRGSRDSRLRYVIHESRIFSSYSTPTRNAWTWGPYGGSNQHIDHVHVSVNRTAGPGTWKITLGDDMADHVHKPMPSELPRDWADDSWDLWVERSGTDSNTRGHTFYREDLSWVYERVIVPMQREISLLAEEVSDLRVELAELSDTSGITQAAADNRYVRQGRSYRIG